MKEYPKTENLLTRDPETHSCKFGELRRPEFGLVKRWLVTEKIDGTNIRVLLWRNPGGVYVDVRGRSDRANVPGDLVESITNTFTAEEAGNYVDALGGEGVAVCIYGEGYGAGIQKGGAYRDDKFIRIFDVTTTPLVQQIGDEGEPYLHAETERTWWRDWAEVERASEFLHLPTATVLSPSPQLLTRQGGPTLDDEDLWSIYSVVKHGFESVTALEDGAKEPVFAEGIVARTDPYLYTWEGSRLMFKLKTKDLR